VRKTYLALAITWIALAGCDAGKKHADNEMAPADTATIENALKSIEAQWEKDYQAFDVDKVSGHYAEDAALANPGSTLATDSIGRRLEIEKFVADKNSKVSFAADRVGVAASGEIAYTRGHYSDETTDPKTGKAVTQVGNYLTVWKKQADGSWRAVEDFVVPGPPSSAPSP